MADLLQVGTLLEGYEIREVVRRDGLSVDYAASHPALARTVIVKELFPEALVGRLNGSGLAAETPAQQTAFDAFLVRFLAQYQVLERIDHPSIVNVRECLSANGTGYAVLDFPQGGTLEQRLQEGGPLPATELAALLSALIDGLEQVHRANLLHRDIVPDHVVISPTGDPVLVGFGAGPRAAGGPRQAFNPASVGLAADLTAGYAPLEQYSNRGQEGPWTDIYALGALAYRCATGIVPEDAPSRAIHDDLVPAVRAAKGGYDTRMLAGIDAALAMRVADRPRSLAAWRALLSRPTETDGAKMGARGRMGARRGARAVREASQPGQKGPNWVLPALAAMLFIAVLTGLDVGILRSTDEVPAAQESPGSVAATPSRIATPQPVQPPAVTNEVAMPAVSGRDEPAAADTPVEPETRVADVPSVPDERSAIAAEAVEALVQDAPVRDAPDRDAPETLPEVAEVAPESTAAPEPVPEALPEVADIAPESTAPDPVPEALPQVADIAPESPAGEPAGSPAEESAGEPAVAQAPAPAVPMDEPAPAPLTVTSVPAEFSDPLASGGAGPVMVRVAPGSFRMGCVSARRCFSNELPVLEVNVERGFAISKHEVTVADYERFTEAAGYLRTEAESGNEPPEHPVANVDWRDAEAYTQWLSAETGRHYRLPTESEWEFAARAGSATAYSWGDDPAGGGGANCSGCGRGNGVRGATPVGSFPENAWGLHDMHGNLWEWVLNCPGPSRRVMQPGAVHETTVDCRRRVRRGGSWAHSARRARSASRDITTAALRSPNTGFRVLLVNP